MLLYLHGFPVCEWVLKRLMQSTELDSIIFALPDRKNDDVLAWHLESVGATVMRGSEMDLVERYYQVAKQVGADQIVRVCADNPLVCGSEIDRLIKFYNQEKCDYAYNHIPRGSHYPDGLGAEICSIMLLEEIHQKAATLEHREHLFNYILEYKSDYIIKTFDPPEKLAYPKLKFDLDTMDDYMRLLEKEYRVDMSAEEIIRTTIW